MDIKGTAAKNWRYLFFIVVTVLIFWALYRWRMVLLPFMVGLLLAYLLIPIVKWIEKLLPFRNKWAEARRVTTILLVFIIFLGVIAFLLFLAVMAIIHSSADLIKNAAQIINNFIAKLQEWTTSVRGHLPESMQAELDNIIKDIGNSISNSISGSVSGGSSILSRITGSFGLILGFAAMPLFLFYLLKDSEKIQKNIYAELPPAVAKHTRNILRIIERVLGRYLRTQLFLGSLVGAASYIGFAPGKIIPVVLFIFGIQLVKNIFLVPKITADRLRLHPALVILLLVVGGYLWGIWGVIFLVPVVATLVGVFNYVRDVNRKEMAVAPLTPEKDSDTRRPEERHRRA
jgi:predicted PurR-regulated permease PerM